MSTLTIEERIKVHAPPKRVWKFLLDPARVAACLPGAKLDGTEGEDTFLGTMKVKVGPVMMEIKGKATMSEVDPVARKVTLSGTGNDKAGGGSARMDMKSEILALDDGGSEILVLAEVHLAGKLVRFGRGMMEGISKQLFKQFAERVHTALDEDDEEEEDEASGQAPEGGESADDDGETAKERVEEAKDEKAPSEAKVEPAETKAEPTAEKVEPAQKDSAEPSVANAESKKDTAEPSVANAESKKDTAEPSVANAESKKDTAEPSMADAESKKDTAEAPMSDAASKKDDAEAPMSDAASKKDDAEAPMSDAASKKDDVAPAEKTAAPAKKKASGALATTKKKPIAKRPAPAEDNAPLDAGGLVWAAIWAWIRGLFGRIFGGDKKD